MKWSDGQPFSADDVVYTFNLMKQQPAPGPLRVVDRCRADQRHRGRQQGHDEVRAGAAEPYFFNFANQVGIVPKHIWSTGEAAAEHPATWPNAKPVGTGRVHGRVLHARTTSPYVANPDYWQPGKPYVEKVQYPAYLDNDPANLDLASGKAQWGGQFIPNIEQLLQVQVAGQQLLVPADRRTWHSSRTTIRPARRPASWRSGRRLAYALDREQISKIGESGYQPAANQSGVVTPTFDKYYDKDAVTAAGYDKPNPDKAKQLLQSAGYSSSNPLKLSVITVTGYTDWDASLAVVKQQLAAVGVELSIQDLQQQSYNQKLYTGDYDLAYSSLSGGPTPYYELRQLLYSKNSAPIGKQANSNYSRYSNPEVDTLFDQYATRRRRTRRSS